MYCSLINWNSSTIYCIYYFGSYLQTSLPIYTVVGESVYAEATGKGKKKDVVVQCALEACRLLDAEGVLRESAHSQ